MSNNFPWNNNFQRGGRRDTLLLDTDDDSERFMNNLIQQSRNGTNISSLPSPTPDNSGEGRNNFSWLNGVSGNLVSTGNAWNCGSGSNCSNTGGQSNSSSTSSIWSSGSTLTNGLGSGSNSSIWSNSGSGNGGSSNGGILRTVGSSNSSGDGGLLGSNGGRNQSSVWSNNGDSGNGGISGSNSGRNQSSSSIWSNNSDNSNGGISGSNSGRNQSSSSIWSNNTDNGNGGLLRNISSAWSNSNGGNSGGNRNSTWSNNGLNVGTDAWSNNGGDLNGNNFSLSSPTWSNNGGNNFPLPSPTWSNNGGGNSMNGRNNMSNSNFRGGSLMNGNGGGLNSTNGGGFGSNMMNGGGLGGNIGSGRLGGNLTSGRGGLDNILGTGLAGNLTNGGGLGNLLNGGLGGNLSSGRGLDSLLNGSLGNGSRRGGLDDILANGLAGTLTNGGGLGRNLNNNGMLSNEALRLNLENGLRANLLNGRLNGGDGLLASAKNGANMMNGRMNLANPLNVGGAANGDIFSQCGGGEDDFPIGIFGGDARNGPRNTSSYSSSGGNSPRENNGPVQKETGIIEKLLQSYGFIQCCERQARLFFHFTQFSGTIEHLRIGDAVEFEMTYDKRTGKPIASNVAKISPEGVSNEKRVTGVVTTELQRSHSHGEMVGRISYENSGECFFLPFGKDDVEGNVVLRLGDKVSFIMSTNSRGNLSATHIRLENAVHPVKYQGVVRSLTEDFGTIERADVVQDIFFNPKESKRDLNLQLADDVEFNIQMKDGSEVACNINKLPSGTVVFEHISGNTSKGQVLKTVERGLGAAIPQGRRDGLHGRIKFRASDYSEVEVAFGEKDQKGSFTLKHGDWVEFHIATDRRDQLRRATFITLLEDSFLVSGERREYGVIATVSEHGEGYLQSIDKDILYIFKIGEMLDVDSPVNVGDEVEFTVVQDPSSLYRVNCRQVGIRIKKLATGTVSMENLFAPNVAAIIMELPGKMLADKEPESDEDQIEEAKDLLNYKLHGEKAGVLASDREPVDDNQVPTARFYTNDCIDRPLNVGDRVQCNLYLVRRNNSLIAKDIRVIERVAIAPVVVEEKVIKEEASEQQAEEELASDKVDKAIGGVEKEEPASVSAELDTSVSASMEELKITKEPEVMVSPTSVEPASSETEPTTPVAEVFSSETDLPSPKTEVASPETEVVSFNSEEVSLQLELVSSETEGAAPQLEEVSSKTEMVSSKAESVSSNDEQEETFQGYLADVRDGFGYIETRDLDNELFFHFSHVEGDPDELEVGMVVEFVLGKGRNNKYTRAVNWLRALPTTSTDESATAICDTPVMCGIVKRPIRCGAQDQKQYPGLIQEITSDETEAKSFEFGIVGLKNKKEKFVVGNLVKFQVDDNQRAINIEITDSKLRASVVAIKGGFGFLSYEIEKGRRLFFHMTNVKDGECLQVGDLVEFSLHTNQHNGKSSASDIVKVGASERPDRLVNLLKMSKPVGPKVTILREPYGPDAKYPAFAPEWRKNSQPKISK